MTPAQAIASLDAQLLMHGEDVKVRASNTATGEAAVRAFVRGYKPQELIGIVEQGDTKIIASPTDLAAVPAQNGFVVVAGTPRRIISAHGIRLAGELVRVEIQVRG